jgi:Raf kinase inhibitor-like YbhB/YbcL family protein
MPHESGLARQQLHKDQGTMRSFGTAALALALALAGCSVAPVGSASAQAGFTITSTAFQNHGTIPLRNSAYGDNVSPALAWTGAPQGTRSFALILDDPDAPMPQPFVHWVIYNIPGSVTGLPEGLGADASLTTPVTASQGPTGLRRPGYFGPRPPAGNPHHYHFRLYALSAEPNLPAGLGKEALLEAIQPHILAETTLMGMYQAQ